MEQKEKVYIKPWEIKFSKPEESNKAFSTMM